MAPRVAEAAWIAVAAAVALLLPGAAALTADDHVKRGSAHFAAGDFSAALDQYHSACDADPKSYMSFFKRATVYLATGRTNHAAKDLSRVLEIRPEMKQARSRLAELQVKDGSYDKARANYEAMPDDPASAGQLAAIEQAVQLVQNGEKLAAAQEYAQAIDLFTQAIEVSPQSVSLRMKRGAAYTATGQHGQAVGDLSRAVKLKSGNVEGYYLLARAHFATGDRAEALTQIRETVKLDDSHKAGFKFYKMLKKFNKAMDKVDKNFEMNRYAEGVQNIDRARELDTEKTFTYQDGLNEKTCLAYVKLERPDAAFTACNATLDLNPKNIEAMILRSELWIGKGEFQAAIDDLKQADEVTPEDNNKRIKEKLNRAEKLLKQSLKRDYYKILGVERTARKKDINKAYRNLAMEWHPDKFSSSEHTDEDRKKAEAKFMDIAAAKEVLSDEKMRRQFDQGEDPLDAEQERERNSGGFPFPGGFPGGGGGHRFHFRHG